MHEEHIAIAKYTMQHALHRYNQPSSTFINPPQQKKGLINLTKAQADRNCLPIPNLHQLYQPFIKPEKENLSFLWLQAVLYLLLPL